VQSCRQQQKPASSSDTGLLLSNKESLFPLGRGGCQRVTKFTLRGKYMKTSIRKTLIGTLALAGLFFTTTNANATCSSGFGDVVAVYEYNVNGTPYGYIYTVPEHTILPAYITYYTTKNEHILGQARIAMENHESLYFVGNATTCPTNTTGYRAYGEVQYVYDY
jgi:hypothetical protein